MVHRLGLCFLVWAKLLCPQALAQQTLGAPLHNIYLENSEPYKADFLNSWSDGKPFEFRIPETALKKPLTNDERKSLDKENHKLKSIAGAQLISIFYQRLLNFLTCVEASIALDFTEYSDAKIWLDKCAIDKNFQSKEMFRFIDSFYKLDGRGLNISPCLAKTEMLQAEDKYPPYDWMTNYSKESPPKAYDAKAFLECVRK
jgi:hypothetical protein